MAAIAHGVDALLFVDMAHIAGLVAAGLHPSPFPHADLVTTTTHKTLRGPRGGITFARADLGAAVDKAVFPGIQGGPLMHVIAAKAVALQAGPRARVPRGPAADRRERAGARRRRSRSTAPRLVSGGTDNHLMLVDVTPLGVTGKEAEHLLDEVGITVNKNAIPFDPLPPNTASGIRSARRRSRRAASAPPRCAAWASSSCAPSTRREDPAALDAVRAEVHDICARFPVPGLP